MRVLGSTLVGCAGETIFSLWALEGEDGGSLSGKSQVASSRSADICRWVSRVAHLGRLDATARACIVHRIYAGKSVCFRRLRPEPRMALSPAPPADVRHHTFQLGAWLLGRL